MNKIQLRKKFRALRGNINQRDVLSERICDILFESDLYKNADTVFCYFSVGSEVSTDRIIIRSLEDKKRVALPKCIDSDGNMIFYYISSLSDLSVGMYGICEPTTDCVADPSDNKAICLVPGLAFSSEGYRLGYGKGYYDRFLSVFQGVSVGICFGECLTETLPNDDFDRKVNYIITENNLYSI